MAQVPAALWDAQGAVIAAQTMQIAAVKTRLSVELSEAAGLCDALSAENAVFTAFANDEIYYTIRRDGIDSHARVLDSMQASAQLERLRALEYQGVVIDLELVRFYLFGREVAVASKL